MSGTRDKHSDWSRTRCVLGNTESIVCCTYSNGKVAFNLCEDDGVCPLLSGYQLINRIPASNCMVCTGSNKSQVEAQAQHKMRVK